MKNDKQKQLEQSGTEREGQELKSSVPAVPESLSLDKPKKDTDFAQSAAKLLVDIIKKNNWSRKLGGQSEHIQYEGWQTAGKYYGYAVKTYDAEFVEYGGTWGFKAKATVVNELTGTIVGGAEALCMSDENNWRNKPKFQLASMAQTRAGSKALRQILGFVIALAGYNPTPVEEMEGVMPLTPKQMADKKEQPAKIMITKFQLNKIDKLLLAKGKTKEDLDHAVKAFELDNYEDLSVAQANRLIEKLDSLPDAIDVDPDEADEAIQQQMSKN